MSELLTPQELCTECGDGCVKQKCGYRAKMAYACVAQLAKCQLHEAQAIQSAQKELMERIENTVISKCERLEQCGISTCDDCGDRDYQCSQYEMAKLKQELGL